MNKRIYFLMIIAFVVGMVELIISGILDLIAADLDVSLSQAGYLITIFALIFALLSPVLLILTANIERKRLMLICLWIFLFGNIITIFSPTYAIVFVGRIISATSGALLTILCLVMARIWLNRNTGESNWCHLDGGKWGIGAWYSNWFSVREFFRMASSICYDCRFDVFFNYRCLFMDESD